MCAIIVDTNTFHKFKNPTDEDMEPVWAWLENKRWQNRLILIYEEIGGGMG